MTSLVVFHKVTGWYRKTLKGNISVPEGTEVRLFHNGEPSYRLGKVDGPLIINGELCYLVFGSLDPDLDITEILESNGWEPITLDCSLKEFPETSIQAISRVIPTRVPLTVDIDWFDRLVEAGEKALVWKLSGKRAAGVRIIGGQVRIGVEFYSGTLSYFELCEVGLDNLRRYLDPNTYYNRNTERVSTRIEQMVRKDGLSHFRKEDFLYWLGFEDVNW